MITLRKCTLNRIQNVFISLPNIDILVNCMSFSKLYFD